MLHEKLKQLRESKGLTQSELAKRLGVSQPMYNYIESGQKVPSLAVTRQLARELECTIDDIVGD